MSSCDSAANDDVNGRQLLEVIFSKYDLVEMDDPEIHTFLYLATERNVLPRKTYW